MFLNRKEFKDFGKFIITVVKDFYPTSFEDIVYRDRADNNEPDWFMYNSLTIAGNLRFEFRKWHIKPFFINLFLGNKILLELDLTRVIIKNGRYNWLLSKPTNKKTLGLFSNILEWRDTIPADYIKSVKEQKQKFKSGFVVPKGGFVLAENLDKESLKNSFQDFVNQIVIAYSREKIETRKINFDFEDAEAEEGYQSDKRYLYTKRNSSIVRKRKALDNYTCQVCGFRLRINNKNVIECHHLKPLKEGGERITNVNDLVSICPTCHRIAHLKIPPFTIKEIKKIRDGLKKNTI